MAVKELLEPNSQAEVRFIREARITARLEHPGVVPVHDAGRWPNGEAFYSMKLVSDRSLRDVIKERPTLDERLSLLPNVLAVADAIAYAHSNHIIHRDLKPSNVIVGEYGETVVIDRGLAKDLAEAEDESELGAGPHRTVADELTMAGDVMGTPANMPPEQARGERVDASADVYALDAMLYHVLAGAPPYRGATTDEVPAKVLDEPPVALEQLEPRVPADIAAIVAKAMARDAADRYTSARELADDLKRFQTGKLVSAHEYSAPATVWRWILRHKTIVGMGALMVVVIAIVGLVSVRRIVEECELAQREREVAQQESRRARKHEKAAKTSRDRMILANARARLETDPTETVAWLKTYPADGTDVQEFRSIAAEALQKGVARRELSFHGKNVYNTAFSQDGRYMIA